MSDRPPVTGTVPYVYCTDAGAVSDWCVEVLGFVERGRWKDDDGKVANIELEVGNGSELWLDGGAAPDWKEQRGVPQWCGFFVEDVDAFHRDLVARGHEVDDPVTREFGVRMLTVTDPEGHLWGFVQRL